MVHTEREPAFVRKFQQAVPHATVQVASAESLPYADGSVAGVLGLCVLDVVDLEAVARELHRVLKPGGSVVQFWDMAPNMRWLCEREMRQGRVLLPDCFSDPLVRAELPAELQAALPPLDFLRDLVSVPSGQLQSLIALLRPSPTSLIDGASLERLARYVQLFDGRAMTVVGASAEAARALAWLCEDEREAYACKRLLLNAWLMLQQARGGDKLPLELRRDLVRPGPVRAPGGGLHGDRAWRSSVTCGGRARWCHGRPSRRRRGRTPEPLALRRSMGGNDGLRRGGTARRPRRPGGRRGGRAGSAGGGSRASWCWSRNDRAPSLPELRR